MSGTTIIYGANAGIGEATARLLHGEGTPLHLVGRNEQELVRLGDELSAEVTIGDVADPELFERVNAEAGDVVDGLVYAVGTINLMSLSRLKTHDFERDFRVNALGAALAIQASAGSLKRSGCGSVVLYSSVAASQGFSMHASIGMAKGAINGLVLSLAAELAPKVRVNAIAPSLTATPLASQMLSNEKLAESITNAHALKRLGSPADIAELTAFLLSERSSWITGQIMGADGGRSTLRIGS